MDRRFVMAIFLSILVLLVFQVWFAPRPPRNTADSQIDSTGVASSPSRPVAEQTEPESPPSSRPERAAAVMADTTLTEETIPVGNASFDGVLTNRGGRLLSWELADYATPAGDRVQIVGSSPDLDVVLETEQGLLDLGDALFAVREEAGPDGFSRRVVFELTTTDGVRVTKTYSIPDEGYLLDLRVQLSGATAASNYRLTWDNGVPPAEGDHKLFRSGAGSIVLVGESLQTLKPGKFKKTPEHVIEGNVRWAGVRNKYFMAALVPPAETSSRVIASGDYVTHMTGVEVVMPLLNGQGDHDFHVYLGPMEFSRLNALGLGLEKGVDLGWKVFRPLSRLLLVTMVWMYGFIPNYGVVIIIVSGLTKILFFPLTRSSHRSMKAMQRLQPQITALREKYKNDPKRMNLETMELYKANKVNPLGGCFPMLLQMPVFIALYSVLATSIAMRRAPFVGWIDDLSTPETLMTIGSFPIHLLPILMFLATIAQQWLTPVTDSRQKVMGYMMPVVMLFIFYSFPAGLSLYWTVNTVITVAQQWSIHRETHEAVPVPASKT